MSAGRLRYKPYTDILGLGALGVLDYAIEQHHWQTRQTSASHKWSFPLSQLTQNSDVTVNFDIDGQQADAELSHVETMALAQFFKRLNWSEVRGCAISDDEAHVIRAAVEKLQDALARSGYVPR